MTAFKYSPYITFSYIRIIIIIYIFGIQTIKTGDILNSYII